MSNNTPYKSIFKSTFLFGFVQVFNIIAKVGINKAVAVFLGTEGMGIIGLFQSTINVLTTTCGLGLSQSAVKDVSQSVNVSFEQLSKSISLTKKLVFLSAILGTITTIILSPWLSDWIFGNRKYSYSFMWLSIVIFLNIITEGQLAILKGTRMLKLLAKSSLFGSLVGLVTSVPLYWMLGEKGIVPSLICASLTAALFSWYYIRNVKYEKYIYTVKVALVEGKPMIKMGIALMYVSFLGVISDYIIRTYISNVSSLEIVGLFQAGSTIITAYFGIIITALTTDYYPRISAINQDNIALQQEFNRQSEVGLLMIGSLVIIFLFAMPLFIHILYTKEFLPIISFLQYAVFGILLTVCSNALGMILLAKQASKIFFYTATIGRILIVCISLIFFKYGGLEGLGFVAIITGVLHLFLMSFVMWKKYDIKITKGVYILLFVIVFFAICAFFIKDIGNLFIRYSLGIILLVMYVLYVLHQIKKIMDIDLVELVKEKFKK